MPPVIPESPKSSFPKWPLIALFSFFLGIASVLACQKYLPTRSLLVGPSSSPLVSPTAGWKTYTNNNFDFSFHYPKNSTILTDTLNSNGSLEFNDFIFYIEKTNNSLDNYVNSLSDSFSSTPINKQIGDLKTIEWIGSYKNAPTHYLSFENNNSVYNFGITTLDDITNFNTKNSNFLDLILSTFKFTDQDSGLVITDQELQQGWYWGDSGQKKSGTPAEWVFQEAGRSSCWHRLGTDCN